MIVRIFAWMGFGWARRTKAQEDLKVLRGALVALKKPGVQLSGDAYRVSDSYATEMLRAEFERDFLNLRNKHAKRRCRVGLVECEMALNGNNLALLSDDLKQIAEEEGLYSYPRYLREADTKDEPLEFTPGRQWGKKDEETPDYVADNE